MPPGVEEVAGGALTAWAARAEALGFDSVAVTDRLASASWDPIVSLAAAAVVTTRVRLLTNVLVAPSRGSAGHLGKQLATLQQLSAGRLVVGVGSGSRPDDFELAGASMEGRHRRLERMLEEIGAIWDGETPERAAIGPRLEAPPPLLIGGKGPLTFARVARYASGWTAGFAGPEELEGSIAAVRCAWADSGRPGQPRIVALTYFGLGPDAAALSGAYLKRYYAFLGSATVARVVGATPVGTEQVRAAVAAFAAVGVEELIFLPVSPDPAQLDLLAAALGLGEGRLSR